VLRQITKPTVLVAGNSESPEELASACQHWPAATVLHGSGVEINGVPFFGLGGAVPVTPFGSWSYDLTEDEATRLLAACPADAVLVTHSPPKGAVDRSSSGASLGSEAVRDAIERFRPRLVVCGHIHESGGQTALLGGSTVINAGPRGITHRLDR
jgi:Icc-related predicted phosphoesterase